MKKFIKHTLGIMAALLVLAGCSDNSTPKEGVQYQALPVNLATYRLAPVTEVFSLTCGHCRSMEDVIPELEKMVGQQFGRVHVTFNQGAQIGAMFFYSAVMQLGHNPDHDMMEELFAAVQMAEGSTLTDQKNAIDKAFHDRNLVSPYEFDETQQKQLFVLMKTADEISQKGQINSVPTFVVNGKYMVLTAGHENAEGIGKTISYLLTQP
ncbi:thiol:disulfide interchange protein DsbA/DsbL [Vibrio fluvialis]|uniref:thiol:disulfide interchange protein DsbA/DsbL n=1 Tax=Vibrio fluvialis TaxID=676 RepID=UPI0005C8DD76|nr:thiol:disulfide interchange protein DsbA/DsbL [Vibrio fluvialis]